MILRVMFKDYTITTYYDIVEISNLSTRFSNDCLRFKCSYDLDYNIILFNDILYFELNKYKGE